MVNVLDSDGLLTDPRNGEPPVIGRHLRGCGDAAEADTADSAFSDGRVDCDRPVYRALRELRARAHPRPPPHRSVRRDLAVSGVPVARLARRAARPITWRLSRQ